MCYYLNVFITNFNDYVNFYYFFINFNFSIHVHVHVNYVYVHVILIPNEYVQHHTHVTFYQ